MSTKTAPVSFCGWCSETVYKLKKVIEEREAYGANGEACSDLLANTERVSNFEVCTSNQGKLINFRLFICILETKDRSLK